MPGMFPIPPYSGFTAFTPTIPKFYWDVYSQEERIKAICMEAHKIITYCDANADAVNANMEEVKALKALFDRFMESGFDDYYAEQVERWIDEHSRWLFENVAKQVFFGLTDDGHFCAYIPEGWQDIQFDTGAIYGTGEYGRLILRYNVEDGHGVIDNTPDTLAQLAEQVRANTRSIKTNLYTPLGGNE